MTTLHTINKSPFAHGILRSCLQICGVDDGILLLEDGVFAVLKNSPCSDDLVSLIKQGVKIFALESDVKARGLENKIQEGVLLTDYSGFVKLSVEFRTVQSWY